LHWNESMDDPLIATWKRTVGRYSREMLPCCGTPTTTPNKHDAH